MLSDLDGDPRISLRQLGRTPAFTAAAVGVLALGIGLILGEAVRVGVVGVAIGSVLGLGVGQALDALFVDVVPFDARVSLLAALLLVTACAVAAWRPALRASRIDPATALRAE